MMQSSKSTARHPNTIKEHSCNITSTERHRALERIFFSNMFAVFVPRAHQKIYALDSLNQLRFFRLEKEECF